VSAFLINYEGQDPFGAPIWSCRRKRGGIVAYGHTAREAMRNFSELEEDVMPSPREQDVEDAIDEALERGEYRLE
jgi:hypothetical protein